MILAGYIALSFAVAWLVSTWLQGGGRERIAVLDHPGARSLHATPTPRTGGLAIAAGLLPAFAHVLVIGDTGVRLMLAGWTLVFVISLLDDLRSLPFWIRLPVHLAAGLCVVLAPGYPQDPLSIAMGLFWIAWGTNLFNFMDGMDGLAGSMAMIGGAAMAAVLLPAGGTVFVLLLFAAAAASAGFLIYNRPPARIFMGDSGSAATGFLMASVSVGAVADDAVPAWLPLLVFLPFIADASFTLVRRALRRKPVWRAHREHLYQALVLSGWPVKRVLAMEILAMLACCSVAIVLFIFLQDGGWIALILAALAAVRIYLRYDMSP